MKKEVKKEAKVNEKVIKRKWNETKENEVEQKKIKWNEKKRNGMKERKRSGTKENNGTKRNEIGRKEMKWDE